MPIASGRYFPFLLIGGAVGRMVGEGVLDLFPGGLAWFPQDDSNDVIVPAGYALVGTLFFIYRAMLYVNTKMIISPNFFFRLF